MAWMLACNFSKSPIFKKEIVDRPDDNRANVTAIDLIRELPHSMAEFQSFIR